MSEYTRFDWDRKVMAQPFNGEALRVMNAYASFSDADTRITFPTIRQVAEATGISVEKVGKYRKELLATGWLGESDEKTSRGNPKLVLTIGEDVKEKSYLGEKKAMNPKSMNNLIPAAKQKKQAQVLDTPDKAGLEHRENAGLEHREIEGLDTPDVTTSELNNHSRTTSYNHASADANAAVVREGDSHSPNYEYVGTLNQEDFVGLSLTMETASYDYLANSEGVYRVPLTTGSRDAAPKKKGKVKVVGNGGKLPTKQGWDEHRHASARDRILARERAEKEAQRNQTV